MTLKAAYAENAGVVHVIVCILAIVLGVLMYAGAWHVGVGGKAAGVVEVTLGILGLV